MSQSPAILTVTDLFDTDEHMPPAEREQGLIRMARLALACTGESGSR